LLPSSSQLGLGNLPIFLPRNKKNLRWKMDYSIISGKSRNVEENGKERRGMG
jgi:hypothetical protein